MPRPNAPAFSYEVWRNGKIPADLSLSFPRPYPYRPFERTATMTSIAWSAAAKVHLVVLMLLVSYRHVLCTLVNTTLEETSPQIVYHGNSWVKSEAGPLYHGGFHDQTEDLSASAVFNFTGVAIYYYSSLWPFNVTTVLTLDGNDTETLNFTAVTSPQEPNGNPVTENSTIRWSRSNLKDGPHSLVMSPGNFVLVDAIM
ncbi:hypothetical protein K435DRAFT_417542 [Dendrothele bispora CBS 962.96]|uniref:Uncharacterized protein n=1 Tax=Dendrothele bispora (strain CBS 962.96) TaxID=1314807 RepID=A0A4V4HIK4_DENBC|nr:hypothetical protein K435DRAFT_417542 [Dendrothele bispora CBS 962.96]